MNRVTFYIDGFNFYYGLKRAKTKDPKWKQFYWIDIVKLCSQFLGHDQTLEKVIYFTASPLSPEKNSRQGTFLNANKLLNPEKFEIVRGKYIDKQITCPYCSASINRPEEKRTDVNISVRMIADCVRDNTDTIILVSADSDLIPPIDFINKQYKNKKVRVYFPPSCLSNDIKHNMTAHNAKVTFMEKSIRFFQNSIMPDIVSLDGKSYTIPEKWKNNM